MPDNFPLSSPSPMVICSLSELEEKLLEGRAETEGQTADSKFNRRFDWDIHAIADVIADW